MRVFFRAYGSHLMGMGHLYRVRKIVDRLREKYPDIYVTLCTRQYDEAVNIYAKIAVDELIEMAQDISSEDEKKVLKKALEEQYDVCINDQLNTDEEIALLLTRNSRYSFTLDDLGRGNYLFDHIVNVLYPSRYPLENEINAYEYMILDDLSSVKKEVRFSDKVKTIFINQGAADTWGAIPDMIDDLNELPGDFQIKALLGPSFQHVDALKVSLERSRKKVEVVEQTRSVAACAKECDLAVLGAGNTLFEIASLGIPIIASTREEKELVTIQRLINDDIVYAENRLYTHGLYLLVQEVMDDVKGRKKKYIHNREIFGYTGIDKMFELMNGGLG